MDGVKAVYTDPSSKGAFGGINKLRKAVHGLSQKDAIKFLSTQESYQLTKPVTTKFPTNRIHVHKRNEIHEADLSDLSQYAKENENYRFLLFVIDLFSKQLKVVPLKNKGKCE